MAANHDASDGQRILYGFWLSPYMSMVAQMLKPGRMALSAMFGHDV